MLAADSRAATLSPVRVPLAAIFAIFARSGRAQWQFGLGCLNGRKASLIEPMLGKTDKLPEVSE